MGRKSQLRNAKYDNEYPRALDDFPITFYLIFMYLQFAKVIQEHNLTHLFEKPDITVFVPNTVAHERLQENAAERGIDITDRKTMENIILYHIGMFTYNIRFFTFMKKNDR